MIFAGMLISIISNDSDTIGDTFGVSLSDILLWGNIAIGIRDCFLHGIGIDYRRYFTKCKLATYKQLLKLYISGISLIIE